jgi:hypothetical protein
MMRTARAQALTPIKTSEVEISFYAKSGAGPSPINGRASRRRVTRPQPRPFPYAARAVFPSASIRRASSQRK